MSNFLNNENLDWHDSTRNYVLKKDKIKKLYSISNRKEMFSWENLEGQFNDEYDEFDIGISKMSYKITENDERFINYQEKINKGGQSNNWKSGLSVNFLLDLSYDEEY